VILSTWAAISSKVGSDILKKDILLNFNKRFTILKFKKISFFKMSEPTLEEIAAQVDKITEQLGETQLIDWKNV
jgi:hypothetical protein